MFNKVNYCERTNTRGNGQRSVSLWCEAVRRRSGLPVMKAAFFQLLLLSADGLIKQVVLKQVKMDAE